MMGKKITVCFSTGWVLSKRDEDVLPVQAFIQAVQEVFSVEVLDSSLTECTLVLQQEGVDEDGLKSAVYRLLKAKFNLDADSSDVEVTVGDHVVDAAAPKEKEQPAAAEEASTPQGIRDVTQSDTIIEDCESGDGDGTPSDKPSPIERIRALVGAEDFKALCEECVRMAPGIAKYRSFETFANQCYLFAINDGNGLSTYLELFADLLESLGLFSFHPRGRIAELKALPPQAKDSMNDPFDPVRQVIKKHSSRGGILVCVDISEWMTKTNDKTFKEFLADVEDSAGENIIVFRVPFVENDILSGLNRNLSDLLFVRNVSFIPFNNEELVCCATEALEARGFTMEEEAWGLFQSRIAEEKNDGRFYGINTVNKVVREMIYRKLQHNALHDVDDTLIKKEEVLGLAHTFEDGEVSGLEVLDGMVGMETLKHRVEEIVAQIETAMKNKSLGTPCIHMRFVGNPGTGKTTVARVVGRILKERGILRNGNFFEYAGRDFCGRYVGETAPKTAAMCRDAYGSVLFIDEAYTLYRGEGYSSVDYGREAIDTLIAEMENHRSDLVVIMAGYPDEMDHLMKGNAGLESRMPFVIEFPNYTRDQLFTIFMQMVNKSFTFGEGFEEAAKEYFLTLPDEVLNAKEFSNARFVRNLFERTWGKAVLRAQLNKADSSVLTKEDFLLASSEKEFKRIMQKPSSRLGFI